MTPALQNLDETSRILAELGLNEYETRAYLTILEGGVVVAREISDQASIPYAKVYQTLNSLMQKHLIIGDLGRPKKFKARDPKIGLIDHLDHLEKDWKVQHSKRHGLAKSIFPVLQSLFDSSEVEHEEEQGVWSIVGLSNISSRLNILLSKAQERITILCGNCDLLRNAFYKQISAIPERIHLRAIVSEKLSFDNPRMDIVVIPKIGSATTIFFDKFAMIKISSTKKGKFGSGEYFAVLTQQTELVTSELANLDLMMKVVNRE